MSGRTSILIVGVGSIGERHLRCFTATGKVDVSFCEVNAQLRQTVAERYQVKTAYSNLEEALSHRPGAAVICTPANSHIAVALQAVAVGAHLLIEKPLSTKLEGVDLLQNEVAARCLTVAVGYVFRAHPALAAMREALRANRFGAPLQIVCTTGQNFPFYRPAYRQTYYRDRSAGGGAVQDALTHVMNAAEWLVGPVDRLVADMAHQSLEGVEVEDTVHVLTRHQRVLGSFSLNQFQAPNECTITVVCERGAVRFEYHRCRWQWMVEPGGEWHDEASPALERDTLFIRQAEAFLDATKGDASPLCSLADAVQTLRVNLAILDSAENKRWIEIER